jgi:arylsulfatase A-like enzyme
MTDRPNLVLVSWDSVRADHVPFHGYERNTTPYLAEMADEGLVFEDAQVPGVGTPTSFTGMFTGEHTEAIQTRPEPEHWRRTNADLTLLSEHLAEEGYHTGAFHFNALMSRHFGWDRGWDVYEDHMWTEEKGGDAGWKTAVFDALQKVDMANFAVHAKKAVEGNPPARWESMWDDIEGFVEEAPEPFFLWVLLIDTHHPYYAPEDYHEWPQPGIRWTYGTNYVMRRYPSLVGERRPSVVNAYDNTLRYADAFLRRLDETLEREGYGDASMVVHSDHGDEFGEHAPEPYGHRPLMYDTVTRVPLVMKNVGETGRVEGPNTLLDVASTLLDLAGSDVRPGDRPSLLGDERPGHDHVVVQNRVDEDEWMVGVVGEAWKLIHHPGEDPAAYYRPDDPFEQHDRWGEHPEALEAALQRRMDELAALAEEGTDDEGPGEETDGDVQERLADLGYLN